MHSFGLARALVIVVVALAGTCGTALAQMHPLGVVEADRIRIQAHLERVEARLRAADISRLTAEQRAARAVNIERLRAYRLRGEFPHGNVAQPAPRVPTFIDADGRACAMGYLVIESGHRDVAEAIARAQNYARVPEIEHPALAGWLVANGMTLEEATLVQPSYCFEECPDAGTQAVCGTDGNVYSNACIATCEGVGVAGPASCSGETCSCVDAGAVDTDGGTVTPPVDSGTVTPPRDSGTIIPPADGGGGGTVARDDGGCSAGGGRGGTGSTALLSAALVGLVLAARRRRRLR